MISIGLGFGTPQLKSVLETEGGNKVEFEPNVDTNFIVALGYEEYGISYGFKQNEDDEFKYGESDYTDFQFRFFMDPYTIELYYQDYQGYYLKNYDEVLPGDTSPTILPELNSKRHAIIFIYTFNDDFSLNHAYSTTRLQKESGGSWLLHTSISFDKFDNNKSRMIPAASPNDYGLLNDLTGFSSYSIAAGPGYSYNLIWGGFYVNATLAIIPSLKFRKLEFVDRQEEATKFEIQNSSAKASLGWNEKAFKISLDFQYDATRVLLDDKSKAAAETMFVGLTYYWRFSN
tara:strand:- start:28024 stop:28887 length:864 start_codon:yes stop_codon:yes gene_type:complete